MIVRSIRKTRRTYRTVESSADTDPPGFSLICGNLGEKVTVRRCSSGGQAGKHGSISVTERVIKTLKYEWLKRVAIIKGIDHLAELCKEFETWYNRWRPHMTLDGIRPDDVYYDRKPEKPDRDAKTVPDNIEQHFFQETRVTGYRLNNVG